MISLLITQLRRFRRLLGLATAVLRGIWSYCLLARRGEPSRTQRVRWLNRVCSDGLAAMQIQLSAIGEFPTEGLIVSNHLSYLDILVLSASVPCAFISKAEIENWAIIGRFARWAGSVFVQRNRKGDAAQKNSAVADALRGGAPVVLFPEGRTTDGRQVLRFHSTMLQPAIDMGALVTPCAIAYERADGTPADEAYYWGDMTLFPQGMKLLAKPAIRARVSFGNAVAAIGDRKDLAHVLHDRVAQLYAALRVNSVSPAQPEEIGANHR